MSGDESSRPPLRAPARQLTLPLGQAPAPSFANFLVGRNAQALESLVNLADGAVTAQRFIYLWGASGSGKSHLLRALAERSCQAVHWFRPRAPGRATLPDPNSPAPRPAPAPIYLADDVDQLAAADQHELFKLFNQVHQTSAAALVVTATMGPLANPVRNDLRTRMSQMLVLQLHALGDAEKVAALTGAARARGFDLPETVANYLMSHFPRDLGSLMAILDGLDQFALQEKRAVTLALLRQYTEGIETLARTSLKYAK